MLRLRERGEYGHLFRYSRGKKGGREDRICLMSGRSREGKELSRAQASPSFLVCNDLLFEH